MRSEIIEPPRRHGVVLPDERRASALSNSHTSALRVHTLAGRPRGLVDSLRLVVCARDDCRHVFLLCYVRFVLDQTLESFLRGHVEAFAALAGVPRTLLYDDLKSVVLERAGHDPFAPHSCAAARGNEKRRPDPWHSAAASDIVG